MNTLFRIFNTLLLIGILSVLILIFRDLPREPFEVSEPVEVTVSPASEPVSVTIDNTPVEVEISR